MSSPLVSVIVATYRRADPLHRALESLMLQSYPELEIILVDDNADPAWSQRVSDVVAQVRARYPACRLQHRINEKNMGSAQSRNAGIRAAQGEFITFLDDDDEYLPKKVALQVQAMVRAHADYSITDLKLFHENGELAENRVRHYIQSTDPDQLLRYHLLHHMTGTDTLMFKARYLREIGGFPPIDVGDEFYLMMRAISGSGQFCYVPGSQVKAFIHTGEGGLSSGEGKIQGENALYDYKKTYFDRISTGDRRYIRMRHYAVLAFAQLRRKNYVSFLKNAAFSFFADPKACVQLLLHRK